MTGPQESKVASAETTKLAYLQALRKKGATGIERATSGVTGRIGHNDPH